MPFELIAVDRPLLHALLAEPAATLGGICSNAEEIKDTTIGAAEMTLAFYERTNPEAPWISYFVKSDGKLVGGCSFVGTPRDGAVEIAYFTFPLYEGRGVATAMAERLIEIAAREPNVRALIAHTLQEENASTRILRKHGFERDGLAIDADEGEVWRWKKLLRDVSGL